MSSMLDSSSLPTRGRVLASVVVVMWMLWVRFHSFSAFVDGFVRRVFGRVAVRVRWLEY